jgi:Holliday junction resolvase
VTALSRNKGANGERELASIIRDWFGLDVTRNWQGQAAVGGSDIAGIAGWAIEVKRAKVARIGEWWDQACQQAEANGDAPALCYRIDGERRGQQPGEKWRVMVRLGDIAHADVDMRHTAEISLDAWMQIIRETME